MALVFLLLPAVVGVGLLAPNFVSVAPAQQQDLGEHEPMYRPGPIFKAPLLVPRDFSAGFVPALHDLQGLFSRESFVADGRSRARMVAFPQNRGELIALDDVEQHLREVLFRDVMAAASVPHTGWDTQLSFLPLVPTLPYGNGLRFDDFPSGGNGASQFTSQVVPEPGTGLLLALGLAALGWKRRRVA